jgi:hypothetical protein
MIRLEAIHTVEILEVGQLDAFAHAQNVRRGAQAVDQHPDVSRIQSRNLAGGVTGALDGVLDISPGGNQGAEDHQTEGEQGQISDGATEPEDLSIGDQDDGQILEDRVNGNGEELESLGAGVDHADQE